MGVRPVYLPRAMSARELPSSTGSVVQSMCCLGHCCTSPSLLASVVAPCPIHCSETTPFPNSLPSLLHRLSRKTPSTHMQRVLYRSEIFKSRATKTTEVQLSAATPVAATSPL